MLWIVVMLEAPLPSKFTPYIIPYSCSKNVHLQYTSYIFCENWKHTLGLIGEACPWMHLDFALWNLDFDRSLAGGPHFSCGSIVRRSEISVDAQLSFWWERPPANS